MVLIDADNQHNTRILLRIRFNANPVRKTSASRPKQCSQIETTAFPASPTFESTLKDITIIDHLLFPLFDVAWTAEEELQLLEGINK